MKWIVADPEHLGGKPRVDGTRISIAFLWSHSPPA